MGSNPGYLFQSFLLYINFLLECACAANFDIVKDIVNSHLNNPLISTSSQTIGGWTVDCTHGHWNQAGSGYDGQCYNWYSWKSGTGSISTTLFGGGRAILSFRNCWTESGYVTVELGKHSQSITETFNLEKPFIPKFS